MATITLARDNKVFYNVTESGASITSGSTYVRYTDSGIGNWIRASITVPEGHKYTITQFYTTYTGYHETYKHGYGFTKEKRDTYVYSQNSSFTYSKVSGTYGSSAGNTYKTSVNWELDAGTWYLYIYQSVKTGAIQFLTTNNTTIQITYTDTILPYIITYDSNGGIGTTASQSVTPGSSVTLASNEFVAPTARLYSITLQGNGGVNGTPSYQSPVNDFYCWRKDSVSGTEYNAGVSFTPSADTTFYAQWCTNVICGTTTREPTKANGYEVIFDANGGTCDTYSSIAIDTTTYAFKEWNSQKDGTGAAISNVDSVLKITSDTTKYAIWAPSITKGSVTLPTPVHEAISQISITLNFQDGKTEQEIKSSKKNIAKKFKGWGNSIVDANGVTGIYTPNSNTTLYAIWGDSFTTYSAISLPNPTRPGYIFRGWSEVPTAESGVMGSYTPTSDVEMLYAIWEPKGSVCLYFNPIKKYRNAVVWVYFPLGPTDANPWKPAIPYIKTLDNWKIVTG